MIRAGVRRLFALALRRQDRWEHEVEEEIKLHLALRAEQLVADGHTMDEATQEAMRRFGPLHESRARLFDAARQREASMGRTEFFADLSQDLSFALRALRRQKAWTAVTVLTLALGIGATTAVFSAVSSLLLHPVDYPGADRVMLVFQEPATGNNTGIQVTITPPAPAIRAWKTSAHSFEALEAYGLAKVEMRTSGEPSELQAARIESSFAHFAGVRPLAGRLFTPSEIADHARYVVLGEGLWRSRFGADQSVIGRAITLDDSLYTILGVMPVSLRTPRTVTPRIDVWLPLDLTDDRAGGAVIGRLRPGVDATRAQAELDTIYGRVSASRNDKASYRSLVVSVASQVSFRDSLKLLAYAVALVLLVACTNVAHLLVARSSGRRRELAIRVALGAGRSRMFRQLLAESVVLAAAGGALGLFGGWLGLRAIVGARPSALAGLERAKMDATTLGIAFGVLILTSLVFGVLGAIQASRESSHGALRSGGERSATGRGRLRQILVVSEMALAATLVVGASMLIRSVINLQRADLGFEPHGLYTIRPAVARDHFANNAARGEFLRTLATRLAATPGMQSVSLAGSPPGWWSFSIGRLEIEGRPAPAATATEFVRVNRVESDYFSTMRQRLAQGAIFNDTTSTGLQVIVNRGFARKQWADESPIGKRIRVAQTGKEPWLTIVGVAVEAQTGGPTSAESKAPVLYSAAADSDASALMVRTVGAADMLQPIKAFASSIDPGVTMKIQSVETNVVDAIAEPRFVMMLLSLFTGLALTLAAIGLYGVMAYGVAQRTREIGIRVALGATRARVARAVIAGGLALAIVGAIAGSAVALWGTKVIESQLFGVARSDAVSFIAAAAVLLVAALVACVVPTRRALAVDPMTAIRAD